MYANESATRVYSVGIFTRVKRYTVKNLKAGGMTSISGGTSLVRFTWKDVDTFPSVIVGIIVSAVEKQIHDDDSLFGSAIQHFLHIMQRLRHLRHLGNHCSTDLDDQSDESDDLLTAAKQR